jgi:hypothetical protein
VLAPLRKKQLHCRSSSSIEYNDNASLFTTIAVGCSSQRLRKPAVPAHLCRNNRLPVTESDVGSAWTDRLAKLQSFGFF